MEMQKTKQGGLLNELSNVNIISAVCTAVALGLIVIISLELLSTLSCSSEPPNPIQINLEPIVHDFRKSFSESSNNFLESSDVSPECSATCKAAQDSSTRVREWDIPSVADEREHEKLSDENFPELSRTFMPVGVSSFLFIRFGAYREGHDTFSIVGLSPKTLHLYGNPVYDCFWVEGSERIQGNATFYLPGIKLAKQYSGTVIHCTFDRNVGTEGGGGSLLVVAEMGSDDRTGLQSVEFTALTENPGEYDKSVFDLPKKYDYMYCGSPLYGDISPQRVREWVAYHARTFGPKSHFIFYDAGGLHTEVRAVLAPWVKLGRVTIMNYRQSTRYDTHYHNQDVVLNDCLLQAKRVAEWAFYFDLDEYLYVPPLLSFDAIMKDVVATSGRRAQQLTFEQRPMNPSHCVRKTANDSDEKPLSEQWGFEKLVYQRTQITEAGGWKDHKYAVQTQYMLAAGIHDHEFSLLPEGMSLKDTITYVGCDVSLDELHYHHYHNTINIREELCKEFVNPWIKELNINNVTHIYDNSLSSLADAIRQYEQETIGDQPFIV